MYNRATGSRLLYILFISQSLFSAGQIAVVTLTAIVAVRLAGTESIAGLPSSVTTFAQALLAFPIAIIMGRFGRRIGLTLGYAAGMLGGLIGVIAIVQGIFALLLLSAVLLGMARAAGEQSRFAAGEMFPEAERARRIGRLVFAGTIGAVVGPVLVTPSGHWIESIGLDADIGPWAVLFLLCAIAALLTLLFLRPDPMTLAKSLADEDAGKPDAVPERPARSLSTLLMLPKVQLAIFAALVSQTVMVVLMVMTPLHMDHHHHGRDDISLVISMHTLGMFGLSPLTGYLIDRFGRMTMLVVAAATLILSALLAPLSTNTYILALALFLLGLGWNFGYVASSSLLADALQGAERARVQGLNDALVFFAAGLGSLAAGPLFASGGFSAISFTGLLVTLSLVVMIVWYNRRQLSPQLP